MATVTMKRTFVDAGGNEIERGDKRRKVEGIEEEDKTLSVRYALLLTHELVKELKIPVQFLGEIMASTHIYNITYRTHQYMRGYYNKKNKSKRVENIEKNMQQFVVKGQTINISAATMRKVWISTYKKLELEESKEQENIAKFQTIVCLMQLFKERVKELQIGPDAWTHSKKDNVYKQHSPQSFGINPRFRHYMSGIGWDVGVRSTLSKFTSGLCQLALLSKGNDDMYAKKNKDAVDRAYGFIPQMASISSFVSKNGASTNSAILDKLASITALHGDKHKRKCSPAFSMIWNHCARFEKPKETKEVKEGMEVDVENILTFVNTEDIGFSSRKVAILYSEEERMLVPEAVDKVRFSQMVFHCVFGTHGEDFGVLSEITNNFNWMKREEFDKTYFRGIKPTEDKVGDHREANKIALLYYSKNVSSSQTKILSQSGGVIGSLEVFSGYRKKHFSEEVLKYLENGDFAAGNVMENDLNSIIRYLDNIKLKLIKAIREIKEKERDNVEFGTTHWYRVEDAEYIGVNVGTKVDIVPVESGECFWSV